MRTTERVTGTMLAGAMICLVPTASSQTVGETAMGTVLFAADSDVVTPAAAKTLDGIAAQFKDPKKQQVILHGHSDPTEHPEFGPEYGMGLAQRRSGNVRVYLVGRGIPPGAITTLTFGDAKPIKGAPPAKLRRVEVFFGPGPGW